MILHLKILNLFSEVKRFTWPRSELNKGLLEEDGSLLSAIVTACSTSHYEIVKSRLLRPN